MNSDLTKLMKRDCLYLSRATQTMVSDDMKAAMQGKVLIKLKYFHVELIRREAAVLTCSRARSEREARNE